jgi:hypothetical protein
MNHYVNKLKSLIWGQNGQMKFTNMCEFPRKLMWVWHKARFCYRIFPFSEISIAANIYLNMLQLFVFPQIGGIEQAKGEILFQLDGAPRHFSHGVRNALNPSFPNRWIGRAGPTPSPQRSPDPSRLLFSSAGIWKISFTQRKSEICVICRTELTQVTLKMLQETWQENEYL